jgi:hypothetical protein
MALHENVVEDQDGVAEVLVVPTEVPEPSTSKM